MTDDMITAAPTPTTLMGRAVADAANAAMDAASRVVALPSSIRRLLVVLLCNDTPDGETNFALAANEDPNVDDDELKHEAFAMLMEAANQVGKAIGLEVSVGRKRMAS